MNEFCPPTQPNGANQTFKVEFDEDHPVVPSLLKWTGLTLLTLGIYRFWAITKLRRFLWSNTQFLGDRFRYHGTVKELFIGFLLALAILLPAYLAATFLPLFGQFVGSIGSFGFFSVILILMPYVSFRRQRYLLTRTSWRGLRFGMESKARGYVWRWLLWSLGSIVTLGILTPWRLAALDRYRYEACAFGDVRCIYVARATDYWSALRLPLLVTGGLVVLAVFLSVAMVGVTLVPLALMAVLFGCFFLFYPWVQALLFRLRMSSMYFGAIKLKSDFSTRHQYAATFGALLTVAVGMGCVMAIVNTYGTPMPSPEQVEETGGLLSLFMLSLQNVLPIVVVFYALGMFANMYFMQVYLLGKRFNSIHVSDVDFLVNVRSVQRQEGVAGVGLADALDSGFDAI
ncbi:DUF898 family protein [Pseudovibrio sp. SPO723]|uniref:DUF898 family protein n=1 Tax=Nesiotobacter zosterae TaxID=392721 RepID=UPI0029C3C7E5|nr:DUF898 family protein [Pseudovibrio sp. SPO723]MDX5594647.1 DUF898 family protein [Pseudovibrio sp. SPO723]